MLLILKPDDAAPIGGTYEEIDSRGQPTGVKAEMRKGEPLPHAQRESRWQPAVSSQTTRMAGESDNEERFSLGGAAHDLSARASSRIRAGK